MTVVKKASGDTWQALLTRETYGYHFSVAGRLRSPSDEDVAAAIVAIPEAAELIPYERGPVVNPFVRHFVPPGVEPR